MRPLYDYGDEVRVLRNLRNDGTFPGQSTGTLLVRRGSTGYVRDVGTFLQDQIIYSVHFLRGGRIVGCREEGLQPASDPWTPSRFESREKVAARIALGRGGRVLVEQGRIGEVIKVLRGPATAEQTGEVAYHVLFPGCSLLQVPEPALEPAPPPESFSPSTVTATHELSRSNQTAIAEQSP
ncbi:MAG: nitrogen fixation protein NifZ [Chromatiaceae bacterium]|nr:nitrogen fixation protein NifZ [Chromatiaceae bacterium]